MQNSSPKSRQNNSPNHTRFLYISALIMCKKHAAAQKVLQSFKDEYSAFFAYSKALVAFLTNKKSGSADGLLKEAIGTNAFIPPFLLSPGLIPDEEPDSYSPGSMKEAVIYSASNLRC
ncbi:MAG: hypothetical protein JST01_26115 [Cyanobacteria bacterium SZAS TMP-1]|nr:hypothetical protein [Cyanobacteria bacterium SZAS TMP-1]